MASRIKVSQMPSASSINDNDLLMTVQGGVNKKINWDLVKNDVFTNLLPLITRGGKISWTASGENKIFSIVIPQGNNLFNIDNLPIILANCPSLKDNTIERFSTWIDSQSNLHSDFQFNDNPPSGDYEIFYKIIY